MAYVVSIYDYSITTEVDITLRTQLVSITKALDSGITTFKVECRAITDTHLFDRMTVTDGTNTIIQGIILNQSDRSLGGSVEKRTVFTCQDWGYFFTKRIAAKIYTSKTASYILNDLVATYVPEFTVTGIDTSTAVISEAKFQYTTLKDAIEYILDMSPDWHYYVDSAKDFKFFYLYESDGYAITASNIIVDTLQVDYEGVDHYNRVWLVGVKQAAVNAIDIFYTADTEQRYFGPLPYEPSALKIYNTPSGLPEYQLDIAEESQDDGSSYDMLYSTKSKVFYFPSYQTPGDYTGKLRANFKPVQQFIDYYENTTNIALYGLMEKAIKNTTVTDKIEARKYGQNEVKKSSTVKRILKFTTDDTDLINSEVGQRCAVSIVHNSWNITGSFILRGIIQTIDPKQQRMIAQLEMEEL